MRNFFWLILIVTSLLIFSFAQCKKDVLPEFYFRCKVDGQDYRPNGCTNCNVAKLLGDTTILINGNRGFESILIGVIKLDRFPISAINYDLDQRPEQKGSFDNSPLVNDIYQTDSSHTGELKILSIDRTSKIISGAFSFQGYNPAQAKTINITEGKFRLKYTTD